jgi:hypothetical protein
MHADQLRLYTIYALVLVFGLITVVGSIQTFYVWTMHRRDCARDLADATEFVEQSCLHAKKYMSAKTQQDCFLARTTINELEDAETGTPYIAMCAWNRLLAGWGWCTSDGCTSTWKIGVVRMTLMAAAIVVIAFGALRALLFLGSVQADRIDARLFTMPSTKSD